MAKALKGSKTHDNLKAAFAGESQANRRYLYFAAKADVEGQNDVSALFRSTAEGETGHAHGHLEYLEQVGDPATNLPIGRTRENLKAAVAGETHEYTDMYPGMATQASARSPTGSRRSRKPSAATQTAFRKRWTLSPTKACDERGIARSSDTASARLEGSRVLGPGQSREGARAHFRHLPRLPPLRQPVHHLPDALRPGRRVADHGGGRGQEGGLLEGRRPVLSLRPLLHDEMPLRSAARVERRLPARDAARQGDQVQKGNQVPGSSALLHRCDGQARR